MILQLLCCFGGAAGAEGFVGSTGESGVARKSRFGSSKWLQIWVWDCFWMLPHAVLL